MLFNSWAFLWFFIVVWGLYLVLDHRRQNILLLIASYFFYGSWDWRFTSLLAGSTLLDYVCGLMIQGSASPRSRRLWLACSIAGNLGILGFFKYYNFFASSVCDLLSAFGFQVQTWTLHIVLPVGISFYTFQTMSYTLDIYRGKMSPTRNFLDFALYVAFFPQLVAGPIERACNLLPQIQSRRRLDPEQVKEGIFLVGWGLFQKIMIADRLGPVVQSVFGNPDGAGTIEVLLSFYAFYIQIYCDFSGYSDIARGLAKMMGFELMLNFRMPFLADRVSDFWSRWHISLTTWVHDYLFISRGGVRKGSLRGALNILIAMTVIGLWHGAKWTFVLWGLYFGLLQAAAVLLRARGGRSAGRGRRSAGGLSRTFRVFVTFNLIAFGGCLFRAENLAHAGAMFAALFNGIHWDMNTLGMAIKVAWLAAPVFAMHLIQERARDPMAFVRLPGLWRFAACTAAILVVVATLFLTADVKGGEEFIYFQF